MPPAWGDMTAAEGDLMGENNEPGAAQILFDKFLREAGTLNLVECPGVAWGFGSSVRGCREISGGESSSSSSEISGEIR